MKIIKTEEDSEKNLKTYLFQNAYNTNLKTILNEYIKRCLDSDEINKIKTL